MVKMIAGLALGGFVGFLIASSDCVRPHAIGGVKNYFVYCDMTGVQPWRELGSVCHADPKERAKEPKL